MAMSSKKVAFHKDGDKNFNSVTLVLGERRYQNIDSLFDELSHRVPLPFGVRNIYTPGGHNQVTSLNDLKDGGHYVCTSNKRIKKIDYVNKAAKKPFLIPRPPSKTQMRSQEESALFTKREKSKVITILAKEDASNSVTYKLSSAVKDISLVIDDINDLIEIEFGPVKALYTIDGKQVKSVENLFKGNSTFIAYGRFDQSTSSARSLPLEATKTRPISDIIGHDSPKDKTRTKPQKAATARAKLDDKPSQVYQTRKAEKQPLKPEPPKVDVPKNETLWLVTVKTSNLEDAGSDNTAYITLYGDKGRTAEINLGVPVHTQGYFRDSINEAEIQVDNVGKLYKVRIGHDDDGVSVGWHLEYVLLTNLDTNEEFYFYCNDWLSREQSDGEIVRELAINNPSKTMDLESVTYEITIYTSDEIESGTDSNIYINIFGEKGDTGARELSLSSNEVPFQRGGVDMFQVKAISLGMISHVKVSHDNSGDSPNWKLEKIEIHESSSQMEYIFECNEWFDAKKGDKKVERILKVKKESDAASDHNQSLSSENGWKLDSENEVIAKSKLSGKALCFHSETSTVHGGGDGKHQCCVWTISDGQDLNTRLLYSAKHNAYIAIDEKKIILTKGNPGLLNEFYVKEKDNNVSFESVVYSGMFIGCDEKGDVEITSQTADNKWFQIRTKGFTRDQAHVNLIVGERKEMVTDDGELKFIKGDQGEKGVFEVRKISSGIRIFKNCATKKLIYVSNNKSVSVKEAKLKDKHCWFKLLKDEFSGAYQLESVTCPGNFLAKNENNKVALFKRGNNFFFKICKGGIKKIDEEDEKDCTPTLIAEDAANKEKESKSDSKDTVSDHEEQDDAYDQEVFEEAAEEDDLAHSETLESNRAHSETLESNRARSETLDSSDDENEPSELLYRDEEYFSPSGASSSSDSEDDNKQMSKENSENDHADDTEDQNSDDESKDVNLSESIKNNLKGETEETSDQVDEGIVTKEENDAPDSLDHVKSVNASNEKQTKQPNAAKSQLLQPNKDVDVNSTDIEDGEEDTIDQEPKHKESKNDDGTEKCRSIESPVDDQECQGDNGKLAYEEKQHCNETEKDKENNFSDKENEKDNECKEKEDNNEDDIINAEKRGDVEDTTKKNDHEKRNGDAQVDDTSEEEEKEDELEEGKKEQTEEEKEEKKEEQMKEGKKGQTEDEKEEGKEDELEEEKQEQKEEEKEDEMEEEKKGQTEDEKIRNNEGKSKNSKQHFFDYKSTPPGSRPHTAKVPFRNGKILNRPNTATTMRFTPTPPKSSRPNSRRISPTLRERPSTSENKPSSPVFDNQTRSPSAEPTQSISMPVSSASTLSIGFTPAKTQQLHNSLEASNQPDSAEIDPINESITELEPEDTNKDTPKNKPTEDKPVTEVEEEDTHKDTPEDKSTEDKPVTAVEQEDTNKDTPEDKSTEDKTVTAVEQEDTNKDTPEDKSTEDKPVTEVEQEDTNKDTPEDKSTEDKTVTEVEQQDTNKDTPEDKSTEDKPVTAVEQEDTNKDTPEDKSTEDKPVTEVEQEDTNKDTPEDKSTEDKPVTAVEQEDTNKDTPEDKSTEDKPVTEVEQEDTNKDTPEDKSTEDKPVTAVEQEDTNKDTPKDKSTEDKTVTAVEQEDTNKDTPKDKSTEDKSVTEVEQEDTNKDTPKEKSTEDNPVTAVEQEDTNKVTPEDKSTEDKSVTEVEQEDTNKDTTEDKSTEDKPVSEVEQEDTNKDTPEDKSTEDKQVTEVEQEDTNKDTPEDKSTEDKPVTAVEQEETNKVTPEDKSTEDKSVTEVEQEDTNKDTPEDKSTEDKSVTEVEQEDTNKDTTEDKSTEDKPVSEVEQEDTNKDTPEDKSTEDKQVTEVEQEDTNKDTPEDKSTEDKPVTAVEQEETNKVTPEDKSTEDKSVTEVEQEDTNKDTPEDKSTEDKPVSEVEQEDTNKDTPEDKSTEDKPVTAVEQKDMTKDQPEVNKIFSHDEKKASLSSTSPNEQHNFENGNDQNLDKNNEAEEVENTSKASSLNQNDTKKPESKLNEGSQPGTQEGVNSEKKKISGNDSPEDRTCFDNSANETDHESDGIVTETKKIVKEDTEKPLARDEVLDNLLRGSRRSLRSTTGS